MQMKQFKNKLFASVLCMVLIVAMALSMTACTTTTDPAVTEQPEQAVEQSFTFEVVDKDGNIETFSITTDKITVGEALLEEGLIAGEDGQYGLYVKEVNGKTLDYNTDGMYWAFYENGSYGAAGVDTTKVTDGAVYGFKAEK
jgi:hypothetical protein